VVPLTDALGSVLALADANGNLLTQYSYDPFGATVASGAASANPFQYIGRENDLTGLYYLHARYYSPALMRFISEDPLGFGGGDVNLHAYSLNSPTNLSDPNGTNPLLIGCAFGAVVDVSWNLYADYRTGRKNSWQDALSWTTAGYAGKGCLMGAGFAAFGVLAQIAAEAVFPMGAAAIISAEIGAAADAAASGELGAAGDAASQSVTDVLQDIVDQAVQKFEQEGFTPAQEAAIAENPRLEPMFNGERIDFFARQIAEDSGVTQRGIEITPRGQSGPDFFNPATGEWWDITTTTPGVWEAHVAKYGPGGTILYY
jgi:RHS repeat-associated protein